MGNFDFVAPLLRPGIEANAAFVPTEVRENGFVDAIRPAAIGGLDQLERSVFKFVEFKDSRFLEEGSPTLLQLTLEFKGFI